MSNIKALSQDDLTKLEKAIATGALRVRFKDHEVTYRSQTEMERAHAFAKKVLAGGEKVTRTVATYHPGF